MSVIEARIRLLAIRLKRFFNTIAVLPVRVLTAFRVVVPYENALHRIEHWQGVADAILCDAIGTKEIIIVPVGEIWIPEFIRVTLSTGTTARFDVLYVVRKDSTEPVFMDSQTAATTVVFTREAIGVNQWLYPGDMLKINVSTNFAGDKGTAQIQRRILRVGDDF